MQKQLLLIWSNLAALGMRRLTTLIVVAVLTTGTIALGARYINKPAYETLYVGLERDDINRIGIVLADAGIRYDIDSAGTSVLVETGRTTKARMILAEKGLPGSSGSGYELFDKLGSLGLTSFMQEVTRVRVLEGEVARSIQAINGIKAARVHIVQPDRRSFGSRNQEATASVLVRTNGAQPNKSAFAIRHLVAAAVPQLSIENVTVLDANGRLLASGQDPSTNTLSNSVGIQKTIEDQLKLNVASALSPYLGSSNFSVNVQATVDTDKRQTEETIFDPESRVERSVQVVKTQDSTSQNSPDNSVSVDQNLPNAEETKTSSALSSQASERREETTNYEVNSKKIATISNSYIIKKLSTSIVLNRKRLEEVLEGNATPEQLTERIEQIKRVTMAAVGFDAARGDVIDVSAVEFADVLAGEALPEPGFLYWMNSQLGTIINSLAFLIVSILIIFLGIRPLIAGLSRPPTEAEQPIPQVAGFSEDAISGPDTLEQLAAPADLDPNDLVDQLNADTDDLFKKMKKSPQDRLIALADENEEMSAQVLKRWISVEAA